MSITPATPTLDELLAHAGWVRGLARRLVEDAAAADDLVQEAWLAALRRPPAAGTPVRPWLARVLRNAARQRARAGGRRRSREERAAQHKAGAGDSPAELAARFETSRLLAELVAGLEEPYREVVLRRYWEDQPASRIARELGIPAGTVRWRLAEARRRLREALDARHGGDARAWAAALIPLALRGPGPATAAAPALPATLAGVAMSGAFKTFAAALLVLFAAAGAVLYGPGLLEAARPEAPEAVVFRPLPPPEEPAATPATTPAPPASPARTPLAAPETPPEGVLVTARILDAARRPLPGATLAAIPQGNVARSGAAGEVQLLLNRPEKAWEERFVVQAPGYATRFLTAVVHPDRPLPLGDVLLEPGGAVSGRVLDADGRPVPGAWVRAGEATGRRQDLERERRHPAPRAVALPARTGPDGRFRLTGVPAGLVRIWAGREGMLAAYSGPVEVRPATESAGVELVLEPFPEEELITGIVLGPDGAPVPRARIRYSHRSLLGSSSGTTNAGPDGRFRIVVRPGRAYDLEARDRAGALAATRLEGVPAGTHDLELRLHEPRSLRLRVVDPEGRPVERYAVTLRTPDRTHVHDAHAAARRPGGTMELTLPDAPCLVEVEAPGFALGHAGPFPAGAQAPEELEVSLTPLPGIRGIVQAGGRPVAGALVRLHREVPANRVAVHNGFPVFQEPDATAETTTDSQGRFTLTLREAGRFRLRAEAPGFAPTELGPLDLDPATGLQGLELDLTEGAALEGVLTLPDGASPAGRIVGISRGDGYARTLRLGADGRFRFEHLTPGPWLVELRDEEIHPGASYFEAHSGRREIPSNCLLTEGTTTWFDLGSGAPRTVLEGSLWLDGVPGRGWTALLMPAGAALSSDTPRLLDAQGRFRLVAPRPGRYRLLLSGPEEETPGLLLLAELELAPGSNPWSADLRLARLTGTGAPQGSPPLTPLAVIGGDLGRVFFVAPLAAGADGRFDLRVPAGPARIVRARWQDPWAAPESWPVVAEVDLPAGGVATVALDQDR